MLSGSLDEFALPDIFALLAATKKTGILHIRTPRSEGWLEFHDGEVAYAVSDTGRMALASRLLGGGLVDDAQLRRIVAAQRGGARALSQTLLDERIVDEETFDALVREQIQDAVFELMRQLEGTFAFDALEGDPAAGDDGGVRVSVSTQQLVAEGGRRLREWDGIATQLVSFDAIVTLAPQPPTESVTVAMNAERWRLLTLVDGRRTVRDLVDLTGQGEYAACQVIAGLVQAGLVEIVDPTAGRRTGVAELVARHELLRRLEERELGGAVPRPVAVRPAPESPEERAAPEPEPPAPVEGSALDDVPDVLPAQDEPQERAAQPAPVPAPDENDEIVGYREDPPPRRNRDVTDEDTFDREEVERELASLGYRRLARPEEDNGEEAPGQARVNRPEDPNRGLLNRLIDIRKQP